MEDNTYDYYTYVNGTSVNEQETSMTWYTATLSSRGRRLETIQMTSLGKIVATHITAVTFSEQSMWASVSSRRVMEN